MDVPPQPLDCGRGRKSSVGSSSIGIPVTFLLRRPSFQRRARSQTRQSRSTPSHTIKGDSMMNVLLWLTQVALALLSLAGGAYKFSMGAELAKVPATSALSAGGWAVLGAFEMVCGVLLIVPAVVR